MSENKLYGEQGSVGYRLLASVDVGTAKHAFEQASGFDNRFETNHVERVSCDLLGLVRIDVEGFWWLSARRPVNESEPTHR